MIVLPDIWKIYAFVLLGVFIGYMGADDHRNLFMLGVPTVILLKNTDFQCHTNKIKAEKQKTFNLGLSIIKECMELVRTFNPDNMEQTKEKVQSILRNALGGMDVQTLLSTGISAVLS